MSPLMDLASPRHSRRRRLVRGSRLPPCLHLTSFGLRPDVGIDSWVEPQDQGPPSTPLESVNVAPLVMWFGCALVRPGRCLLRCPKRHSGAKVRVRPRHRRRAVGPVIKQNPTRGEIAATTVRWSSVGSCPSHSTGSSCSRCPSRAPIAPSGPIPTFVRRGAQDRPQVCRSVDLVEPI